MDAAQILNSIESATNACASVSSAEDRKDLLAAAQKLVSTLTCPQRTLLEFARVPAGHAALRTAIALKIFNNWADEREFDSRELAERTGAQELLIARIMRTLTSIGIFEERGERMYGHSTLSQILIEKKPRTMIAGMSAEAALGMWKLPEYLASIEYYNPAHQKPNLHQFACDTKRGFPEWLRTQPINQRNLFDSYLATRRKIEAPHIRKILIALFHPVDPSSRLKERLDDTDDSLVAICPSHVQELEKLAQKLQGRVVLQNPPPGINGPYRGFPMKSMIVDLQKPQEVQGAYTYLFLHTLQQWSDETCQKILKNTVSALTPGFSRVIIVNQVLPDTDATAFDAFTDLIMMTSGAIERTERQWRRLLLGVGLIVRSIEKPAENGVRKDSVITAMVPPRFTYPRRLRREPGKVMEKVVNGKRTRDRRRWETCGEESAQR